MQPLCRSRHLHGRERPRGVCCGRLAGFVVLPRALSIWLACARGSIEQIYLRQKIQCEAAVVLLNAPRWRLDQFNKRIERKGEGPKLASRGKREGSRLRGEPMPMEHEFLPRQDSFSSKLAAYAHTLVQVSRLAILTSRRLCGESTTAFNVTHFMKTAAAATALAVTRLRPIRPGSS